MNNNNLYSMVPRHIRRDIKKIRQFQNTKATILNGELNKLLNSLNKFNNEYSKLVNNIEKKLLEVNSLVNYRIENINNIQNIQNIQNGIINQTTKLNNIFSAMNEYIENLQDFIDQNQINPNVDEIQRVEEKKQIQDTAYRMAMSFISYNMMTNNLNNLQNTSQSQLESSNSTLFTTRTLNNQNQNDNNYDINDDSDF